MEASFLAVVVQPASLIYRIATQRHSLWCVHRSEEECSNAAKHGMVLSTKKGYPLEGTSEYKGRGRHYSALDTQPTNRAIFLELIALFKTETG